VKIAAFALAALALATVPVRADAPGSVSVLYAGSLVTPMEGPVKAALASAGIEFLGQPGGSKALANMIDSGLKTPDVFISVDRSLVEKLGDKVASSTTFATTSLGLGWEPKSNYAYVLESVGHNETPLLVALAQPGLRIGRTDPAIDPKGSYTIAALTLLLGAGNEKRILGADDNPAQIYPEEELLARLETGEVDVGVFYTTEAVARNLEFAPFPGEASMSDKITYTLAIMKNAQHPAQAQAFADFILKGPGRAILEKAGLRYVTPAAGSR
jgi:molybdate/tungstate transport system substrate-binding protein